MININRLITFISIFLNPLIFCADTIPITRNLKHTEKFCSVVDELCQKGNFTVNQIESLLSCRRCKQRAFNCLILYVKELGPEKSDVIANVFIKNGITVNDYDDEGGLPIVTAVELQLIEAVNFLISLKANVNLTDNEENSKQTALYSALLIHDKKIQLPIIKSLLEAGADSNKPYNEKQETLLHLAMQRNDYDIILLLLKYGADLTITAEGNNFLDYANDNNLLLIEFIINVLFEPDLDKVKGAQTALLIAAYLNNSLAVGKLLHKGVWFSSEKYNQYFNNLIADKPNLYFVVNQYHQKIKENITEHLIDNLAQII